MVLINSANCVTVYGKYEKGVEILPAFIQLNAVSRQHPTESVPNFKLKTSHSEAFQIFI